MKKEDFISHVNTGTGRAIAEARFRRINAFHELAQHNSDFRSLIAYLMKQHEAPDLRRDMAYIVEQGKETPSKQFAHGMQLEIEGRF